PPERPRTYESIHIWKGIAPNGTLAYLAKVEGDAIVRMDGSRASGTSLRVIDGAVTMTSKGKQHKTHWDKMRAIGLAIPADTTIKHQPVHAVVYFDRSEILLRIETMTAKHLTGTSPVMGAVRILRTHIKSIDMR
ncbi:MAG: hypothetical protein GY700_09750, partial [Propionibacteriaceae bacterium]|nr:hypothetical protein [Propionibacteriaceae bacterium]